MTLDELKRDWQPRIMRFVSEQSGGDPGHAPARPTSGPGFTSLPAKQYFMTIAANEPS